MQLRPCSDLYRTCFSNVLFKWNSGDPMISCSLSCCGRRKKVVCVLKSYSPRPERSAPGSPVRSDRALLTEHAMRLPQSSPAVQRGEILIEWKDGTVTPLYEAWRLRCSATPPPLVQSEILPGEKSRIRLQLTDHKQAVSVWLVHHRKMHAVVKCELDFKLLKVLRCLRSKGFVIGWKHSAIVF